MNIIDKSKEQLAYEIIDLQRENQALLSQLAFHKKVFKEFHSVLGIVQVPNQNEEKNHALQNLLAENEQLKYKLKILKLSNRERQILQLILDGNTSKEIANSLNISKLTVDTHRKHIQQKLEVNNSVELIKLALRGGMA